MSLLKSFSGLILSASLVLWAGAAGARAQTGEYGDAPEGALAYTSLGVTGMFPTCAGIGPPGQIRHSNSILLWLGPMADPEPNGNAGLCPNFAPYDADECYFDGDAGLIIPAAYTIQGGVEVPCPQGAGPPSLGMTCSTAMWGPNIDIEVHNALGSLAHLNVLIDWDQSGAWAGASQCPLAAAPEHVLVNFVIPPGFHGPVAALGPPGFLIGPKAGYVWMRVTLSNTAVPATGWTGEGSFTYGETEDYLIRVDAEGEREACCPPDGRCYMEVAQQCAAYGHVPMGPGSVCLGDNDGDGLDDLCEGGPLKFIQPPDTNRTGIDIKATFPNILADDFLCTRQALVTNITIWGSWKNDVLPGGNAGNVVFTLSIHDGSMSGGMPGPVRWFKSFPPGSFTVTNATPAGLFSEAWWDPATGLYLDPGDQNIWRYDFTIPAAEAYCQTGSETNPKSYWLDVQAQPTQQSDPPAEFGWKTVKSPDSNFGSAAVWGMGSEPYPGPWSSLYYPTGVWENQPIGLAFSLSGDQICEPAKLDFGDAPEGSLAYPASGMMGNFPTCMNVLPVPWIQHTNFGGWFGPLVDFEADGNGGLCPVFAPYDNDECINDGDAGLLMPQAYTIDSVGNVIACPTGTAPNSALGPVCTTALWGANIDIQIHNWMPNHSPYVPAYVNVLIDWDQSGNWSGASPCPIGAAPEWVLQNFVIPPQYDGPLSALVPPNFLIGPNAGHVWVRFSLTEQPIQVPDWDGSGAFEDGETEDYLLQIDAPAQELDWGDAPDGAAVPRYPTLSINGGAHHRILPGFMLGNAIDSEGNGQPDATATGDDLANIDDEDGVTFNTALFGGVPNIVTVTATVPAGMPAILNAWLDLNGDGDWLDGGEQIFMNQPLVNGPNSLSFTPGPITAVGRTFARFRLSTQGNLPPGGPAPDGEVEDYEVQIVPVKWLQRPDLTPEGVDVDNFWVQLADDFRCTQSGPITDIHIWASFWQDLLPPDGPNGMAIALFLYKDVPDPDPADPSNWSHPGERVWSRDFQPGSYAAGPVASVEPGEWWHDPATMLWQFPGDKTVYQLDFTIPPTEAYRQREGQIYWLGMKFRVPDPPEGWNFGWKTSPEHWNDDACWLDTSMPVPMWKELRYAAPHPMEGQSMDLAFAITGTYEQPVDFEFGDAPEGVLAYPATGTPGAFPTCITVGPASWIQHNNFGAWLGPAFDFETDGNAGLCPVFAPYDADECFADGDAGLLFPPPYTILGGVETPCPAAAIGGSLGSPCLSAIWGRDIDVDVHNHMPSGTTGYLNVLIDWDQSGTWGGVSQCPGPQPVPEHVLVDFPIPNPYDGPVSALMAVNTGFTIGPNRGYCWTRITITERPVGMAQQWDGSGNFEDGETEDYLLRVDADYGDAPDPTYPTLQASNGASHGKSSFWMGPAIDFEVDGQPDPGALGDDNNPPAGPDDEDGVVFNTWPLTPGQPATITVQVTSPPIVGMYVNMWIDFNGDGSWAQLTDQVVFTPPPAPGGPTAPVNPGINVLTFVVPNTATPSISTFARIRLHTNPGGVPFTGYIPYGEVEDYRVEIGEEPPMHDLGDAPDSSNSFPLTPMTAYPPGGPPGVIANFPTVYQVGSPPYGPLHRQPLAVAFLGNAVTLENEADTGPDQDPTNNLIPPSDKPDLDGADDGVLNMPLALPHCTPTTFRYNVTFTAPVQTLYVNVWFDWNRDGDWDDAPICPPQTPAPEWAVQNQMISSAVPGLVTFSTPPFLPWHPATGLEAPPIWMRITLAEQPWQLMSPQPGYGGSGPQGGYEVGETEDYYFTPCMRRIVGRHLFYNNSFYDTPSIPCNNTFNGGLPCNDNTALATNLIALLPGQAPIVPPSGAQGVNANYSSFTKGINGIIIDVAYAGCPALPAGPLSPADVANTLQFQETVAGNGGRSVASAYTGPVRVPTSVIIAPHPALANTDRITIIFADNTSTNSHWLRTRVLTTGVIDGLAGEDRFYFGLAKAEYMSVSGTNALTNNVDQGDAQSHPRSFLNRAPIDYSYDSNRDSLVNNVDQSDAQSNPTSFLSCLQLTGVAP